MTWLNWSLSFTLDYWVSHFWYPHTSHMSMFNECHIHLRDCTWLNVFHILNFCWSNTKRFLSVLIFFWKVFCFCKNFKKLCCPVLVTWSWVKPVASPQSRAYLVGFRGSLAGQGSSREKHLEKFHKSGCLAFLRLSLATCSLVEALVARLYRSFRSSLHNFLMGGPSSREKHLDKFFKIFVSKVFGDLSWRLVHDSV